MEKKILTLVICTLLLMISCSNSHKFNNDYSNDENKIIFDFISSENPKKDKIFNIYVDRSLKSPYLIFISKGHKPMYPLYDFTVDSIKGSITIFQSERPLKDLSFYEKYIKEGYVVIDNAHHEDFMYENYIIVYCPENKNQKTYKSEEYYNAFDGNEETFLNSFCN